MGIKFSKNSDSVTHLHFERSFLKGIKRYTLLAQDRTRAVYLMSFETTNKVVGLAVITDGIVHESCDTDMLLLTLENESKDKG